MSLGPSPALWFSISVKVMWSEARFTGSHFGGMYPDFVAHLPAIADLELSAPSF